MKVEIKKVDVEIEQPKVQQVTAESNPKVWAMLQPPAEKPGLMTPPILTKPYPSY